MKRSVDTVEELVEIIARKDAVVIDCRPLEAYNGWKLRDEPRGGHIRSAKSFPARWLEDDQWPKLLEDKGITPDKAIVAYGYGDSDTTDFVIKLTEAGFKNVRHFNKFAEWSANDTLPMERLARYKNLVYPQWVKGLIDGENPPEYDGRDYVICHCSFRYREDYEAGHIPGAIHLDTELLEDPETWNRRSPDEIKGALKDLGIDQDTMVVVYGRFNHPNNKDEYPGRLAGHLAAMRCAVILMYAGVRDVRVLNGGMVSWRGAQMEMSTEEGEIRQVGDFGATVPVNPGFIIDMPEAKELLASDDGELVSIRSWEEFIGNVSGYNYIEKAGRIPGAIFGDCGSDAYHMENYRNFDQTMREYHEIANIWADSGIVPTKHIAFYCGTGWRASEAFLNAYLMGWPRISVYDGGWMEWRSDPNNPIEMGIPEGFRPAWQR